MRRFDDLQVLHSCRPPDIEQVLAGATVASAPALSASQVSQPVLYGDPLAYALAPFCTGHQLAQSVLKEFVVCDGDCASTAGACCRALGSQSATCAQWRRKFYVSAKIDGFSLTGWAGDGPVAHVDLEIGLGEEFAVARDPRLADDVASVGEDVSNNRAGNVAAINVHLGNSSRWRSRSACKTGAASSSGRLAGVTAQAKIRSVSRSVAMWRL